MKKITKKLLLVTLALFVASPNCFGMKKHGKKGRVTKEKVNKLEGREFKTVDNRQRFEFLWFIGDKFRAELSRLHKEMNKYVLEISGREQCLKENSFESRIEKLCERFINEVECRLENLNPSFEREGQRLVLKNDKKSVGEIISEIQEGLVQELQSKIESSILRCNYTGTLIRWIFSEVEMKREADFRADIRKFKFTTTKLFT